MKDEIKEILEKPNIYVFAEDCYLWLGDYNKLKDYITNLQNEIDNLKDQVEWWKQQCDDLEMQVNDNE